MVYSVNTEAILDVQEEFVDLFRLERRFHQVQPSDNVEYWDSLLEAARCYYKKHPGERAKKLVVALLDSFEERAAQVEHKTGKDVNLR